MDGEKSKEEKEIEGETLYEIGRKIRKVRK